MIHFLQPTWTILCLSFFGENQKLSSASFCRCASGSGLIFAEISGGNCRMQTDLLGAQLTGMDPPLQTSLQASRKMSLRLPHPPERARSFLQICMPGRCRTEKQH